MDWTALSDVLRFRAEELLRTELDQIRFTDIGLTYWLSVAVVLVGLATLARLWGIARFHHRQHSGHRIDRRFRRGALGRTLYHLPKAVLGPRPRDSPERDGRPLPHVDRGDGRRDGIAHPHRPRRHVPVDVVGGCRARGGSRAEVAREAHLEFLEMRRAKNDRVAFVAVLVVPLHGRRLRHRRRAVLHPGHGCAVRHRAHPRRPIGHAPIDQMYVPPDKVRIVDREGNTNIVRALQSVLRHFDRDVALLGRGATPHRAVLIVTDADVDEIPEAEFVALSQRNIVPYMIFINAADSRRAARTGRSAAPRRPGQQHPGAHRHDPGLRRGLLRRHRRRRAWSAPTRRSTTRRRCPSSCRTAPSGVPIYARFLLIAMALFVVGIPPGSSPSWFGARIRRLL